MKRQPKEVWLEQMHVFPNGTDVFEHDVPYLVEFEATTGVTRTREFSVDEIASIRARHKLPQEKVVTDED